MTDRYTDRRAFPRLPLACTVMYKTPTDRLYQQGAGRNLSSNGILFIARQPLPPGTLLDISVLPERAITPPLNARIEVIRSHPLDGDNTNAIAACIREILPTAA